MRRLRCATVRQGSVGAGGALGNLIPPSVPMITVTSFIFLIVVGANILTFGFDYLKVSQALMSAATDASVGRWTVLAIVIAMFVTVALLCIWPEIALWLTAHLK